MIFSPTDIIFFLWFSLFWFNFLSRYCHYSIWPHLINYTKEELALFHIYFILLFPFFNYDFLETKKYCLLIGWFMVNCTILLKIDNNEEYPVGKHFNIWGQSQRDFSGRVRFCFRRTQDW